jgi:hypothetical protein
MAKSFSGIPNILLCIEVMKGLAKMSIMPANSSMPIFRIDAHPSNSVSCESVIIGLLPSLFCGASKRIQSSPGFKD